MYDIMARTEFGEMLRALRVSRGLTQRKVAEGADVSGSTVGNAESAPHRVMGRDSAHRVANMFGLLGADRDRFMALWEATPLSEYSQRRKATWEKRNALRGKAKNHDRLQLAAIDLLAARLMDVADEFLCQCEFGEPSCLTCGSLESLGLPPYTGADRDQIFDQLEKLREKLVAPPAERP
jgi:transcriptional regulator with XRE-family HTH domain